MSIILLVILLIAVLLLVFFYVIEPKIMKAKINNENEYGSARFATIKEIKETFKKENVSNIVESGFPVYFSKKYNYVWFDRITPHYVYLGSTGSGKSVTAVIPSCTFIANAKVKRSVFITDPKGEIFKATSKMFKDKGYKILTIDFRNPECSNKINLLEPIVREYEEYIKYDKEASELTSDIIYINTILLSLKNGEQKQRKRKNVEEMEKKLVQKRNISMKHLAETNRLISSLSTMIMSEKIKEKDPFWNNSARNLLEGLIGLFLEEYKKEKIKREEITLTSVKKFQNSSMDDSNFEILKEYIDKKPYGVKSKDCLTSIFASSENTYKSITATFAEKMALFDDVNVANITSRSDFDFDILGKEPTVIYIIVPDEDKTYYSLITIIIGLLYRELVKLANKQEDKKLPINIDWLLDEFANCPPLADIEAIVSVARSRGMRFQFFIQSLSQLDNVYGKDIAQIILDNCGLVYLKTNTQETAEAISKRLGKKTIESNSVSQSFSKTDYNGNRSISLMGRDLLTPEEVKQLHYKTIIFPIIGFPIFRSTILYEKFNCYKSGEMNRKVNLLEDLKYTYFTVEKLSNKKMVRQRTVPHTTDEEEFNKIFKESFIEAINKVKNIVSNQYLEITYPEINMTKYCMILISNILGVDDKEKILNLEDNNFHFVVTIKEQEESTKIEIHKKVISTI